MKKMVFRNVLCLACALLLFLIEGCGAADSASSGVPDGSAGTQVSDAPGISEDIGNQSGGAGAYTDQPAGFTDEPVLSNDNIDPETGVFNNELFDDSDNKSLLGDLPNTSDEGIDVDLTKLSSVVIYSVVFDMMQHPDDYPEAWDEITVVGDFDTYLEAGSVYCTLRDARLE